MRRITGAFLAGAIVSALAVAPPGGGRAGDVLDNRDMGRPDPVAPRTDANSGWKTQEWPQRGQDAANRSCYTGEFTVARTIGPDIKMAYPSGQHRQVFYGAKILGAPTTAYNQNILLPTDRSARDISGYGCMAVTVQFGTIDGVCLLGHSGNFGYQYDSEWFGGDASNDGYFPTVGSFMGSPAIIPEPFLANQGKYRRRDGFEYPFAYGYFYVMGGSSLGEYGAGLFFKWTAIVVASSGQDAARNPYRYHTALRDRYTYGVTDHLIEHPVAIDGPFAFAVNRGQIVYNNDNNPPTVVNNQDVNGVWTRVTYPGALIRYNWDKPLMESISFGGNVYEFMVPDWTALLQLGNDDPRPLPKGQEPAYSAIRFNPVTSPAIRGDLAVIGAQRLETSTDFIISGNMNKGWYALIAFNAQTGVRLWWAIIANKPVGTPVVLKDRIIFTTRNSMVFCYDYTGRQIWRTKTDDPLFTYRPKPISDPQETARVELSGLAVDSDEIYVYAGGTDGRMHRFSTGNGEHVASEVMWYYQYGWNANRIMVYYPCAITMPPAIYRNKSILFKAHTQKLTNYGNGENDRNASCLMILHLPDLTYQGGNVPMASGPGGCTADVEAGVFSQWDNRVYGIWMTNSGPTSAWQDNYAKNFYYNIDNGYHMDTGNGNDADEGGVSLSNGMVLASDRGGNLVQVPSSKQYTVPVIPPVDTDKYPRPVIKMPNPRESALLRGEIYGNGTGPSTGSGGLEVYPNPFNPSKAQGGKLKFQYLPEGSRVEIYTLDHERVRILHVLTASGNRAQWDGRNEAGQDVASGVYLYRVVLPGRPVTGTGRIVLVRK